MKKPTKTRRKTMSAKSEKRAPSTVQDVQPVKDEMPKMEPGAFPPPFTFDRLDYQEPPLGLEERRVLVNGKMVRERLIKDMLHVKTWRRVCDFPIDPEGDALGEIDALLAQAKSEKKPDEDTSLDHLKSVVAKYLQHFFALAANGNEGAVTIWGDVLRDSLINFKRLALVRPEFIEEWARANASIPGLISQNSAVTKSNRRIVERLRVGEDHPFRKLFIRPAHLLAARLINHIQNWRDSYETYKRKADGRTPECEQLEEKWGVKLEPCQKLPDWLPDAMTLEPFSAKTWKAWGEIAWLVLAEISPDKKPGKHPAFYAQETKICNVRQSRTNPYYGNKEEAPSIAENHIRETLFGAFELLATGTSQRTARRKKAAKPA